MHRARPLQGKHAPLPTARWHFDERHAGRPLVERETVRERLSRQRGEAALARTPGWLGAGHRWLAFAEPVCPCCTPDHRGAGR